MSSKALDLSRGAEVLAHGSRYVITNSAISFDEVEARDLSTGTFERLKIVDLQDPVEDVPGTVVSDLTTIESERLEEARRRKVVLDRLLAQPQQSVVDMKSAAEELRVGIATIYRWFRRYREDGRLTSLLPTKRPGGRGRGRLSHPDAERFIKQAIDTHYLTSQQKNVLSTSREVSRLCRNAGIAPPHESTVRRRVHAITEKERLKRRGHSKAAHDLFDAKPDSYVEATQPLAVVQIDHTLLDVILVDEEHRLPLKRPWLTLVFDVYSRMVLGFYISFDSPGALGTGLAIARAILPKESWLRDFEIDHEWPCWGFPTKLHMDNAGEFRGEMVRRACEEYGITTAFRNVGRPEYGGHIERMLGTLAKQVHELPGAAQNPRVRGEYDSEAEAALTLSELEELLTVYFTSVYHQSYHSGLKCAPIKRWRDAILGTATAAGVGPFPRPKNEERLLIDFMPVAERTVQPTGVQIDGIRYYSDVLRPHIGRAINGTKRRVFRRDPRDISKLYFWDPDMMDYATIPYRDVTRPVISVWELAEVRRLLEAEGKAAVDEDAIFDGFERMRASQEKAKTTTRQFRRNREREKKLARDRQLAAKLGSNGSADPEPRHDDALEDKPLAASEPSEPAADSRSTTRRYEYIAPLEIDSNEL